jgi:hypothetical protein
MASTTFTDNQTVIYAAWLNDVNNAVYNGNFVSPSITATNMICNGTASGAGFTALVNNTLASPTAIGNVTPNTGAFTALTANTVTASTAIAAASGGTGVSSSGAANNILASNGTNWISKPLLDYFGYALGNSGYQKFPGGLILQWGQYNLPIADTAGVTVTFPIAFPNQCFTVYSLLAANSTFTGSTCMSMHGWINSTTQATFYTTDVGNPSNGGFFWLALGY